MPTLQPITPPEHLHAFEGFGIEVEYIIAHQVDLDAWPVADRLLVDDDGQPVNEQGHGRIAWSNELVNHVIELKTNGPAGTLAGLDRLLHAQVTEINRRLDSEKALLLPTGMHPWFDPERDTQLWPHGQNEIYAAYDRIFGCKGHGWSNLQSVHINLPFADDDEFRRLHAAVRAALPLIPALAADSPFHDDGPGEWLDNRLRFYRDNQAAIPEIAGAIIPEPVGSMQEYHDRILAPMYAAIEAQDTDGILAEDWLNSRGAIARFDRQTIEIRLIDTQECPRADLAIVEAVVGLVTGFYEENLASFDDQQALDTRTLAGILFDCAARGADARVDDLAYLKALRMDAPAEAGDIWRELADRHRIQLPNYGGVLAGLLDRGPLAAAIFDHLGMNTGHWAISDCYRTLAGCLAENRLFRP